MSLHGVPRLSRSLIDRPRLADALDAATPLIVLHAPAGYGKTVALSQWARATALTGVWLRVDQGAGEPGALVGALAQAMTDAGQVEPDNPLYGARHAIVAGTDPWELLRRGIRMLGTDIAIALDECENLETDTVLGLLQVLLDVPSLVLRVATRRTDAFAEPALAIRLDVQVISVDTLRLTPAEASEMLGVGPESPRIGDVLLNGGAPGLARLLTLGASAHAGAAIGSHLAADGEDASSRASVLDIVESVLRIQRVRWSSPFVDFIETIALADRVDVDLATELTGDPEAPRWLDIAESEGIGQWQPLAGSGEVIFTMSPFFMRTLDRVVRSRTDTETQRAADLAVAAWEFRHGNGYVAVRRAADAEAWSMVNDIICVDWHDLLRSPNAIMRTLEALTPAQLQTYPFSALMLGVIANRRGQRQRALASFRWAVHGARQRMRGPGAVERATYTTVAVVAYRASSQLSSADELSRELLRDLEEMSSEDRRAMGPGYVQGYLEVGTTLMHGGQFAEAAECFRQATSAGELLGEPIALQAIASTVGLLAISGDIVGAAAETADLRGRPWPPGWIGGYQGMLLELAETIIRLERGDLVAARVGVDALASRSLMEHWALLLQGEALLLLLEGNPHDALRRLDAVVGSRRAQRGIHPPEATRLALTRSTLALAAGDAAGALRSLPRSSDPAVALSRARICLAAGDAAGALGLLHAQDFSRTLRDRKSVV